MEHNDGGQAFPDPGRGQSAKQRDLIGNPGMALRDYFAAKAMQAFLSGHIAHHGHESHWPYDQMASEAWDVADAMIAARGTQP